MKYNPKNRVSLNKDLNLIVEVIKGKLKTKLLSVYIFGSIIRGCSTDKSDYDILIITKDRLSKEWEIGGEIRASLLDKVARPVDIIFQEVSDLDFPSPLWYELNSGSRLLYGTDVSDKMEEASSHVKPLIKGGAKVGYQIS